MAAGFGLTALKTAHQNVKKELENLSGVMNTLKSDVEYMNAEVWSGGENANDWYQGMEENFNEDVVLYNKMVDLQNTFNNYIKALEKAAKGGK